VRFNEIQDLSNDELFGYTNLVREIARFLWRENTPSNKCIYPENISKYLRSNSRLDKLWHSQSQTTQEFMADQIYAAMYQMELDSFTESQDNNDDDMFGASIATLPKVESILAAGIPLYITNVVANDKDRRCRVKEIQYETRTFGQLKPFISFWLSDAQISGSSLPWNDREWQLQRTEDGFVLWPRDKKLQETHSDDNDVFAERTVSQKIMHLVQTGQPIYYVANSEGPRDQWRLREIIRATPNGYTWLNHSGITINYDYESFPVRLEKSKDGKIIAVPTRIHDVTGLIDESTVSDEELFGPRAVTRNSLQQMLDDNIPVYYRIQSNGEDARITHLNPPMEGYPGYWLRYRSPTQRGMLAWRDRFWSAEAYRDGVILQQLPGARLYESESDDDLFFGENILLMKLARLVSSGKYVRVKAHNMKASLVSVNKDQRQLLISHDAGYPEYWNLSNYDLRDLYIKYLKPTNQWQLRSRSDDAITENEDELFSTRPDVDPELKQYIGGPVIGSATIKNQPDLDSWWDWQDQYFNTEDPQDLPYPERRLRSMAGQDVPVLALLNQNTETVVILLSPGYPYKVPFWMFDKINVPSVVSEDAEESDEDLFGTDDLRSRLHARIHAAWKKITDTLDELGPETIWHNAKVFSKLWDKWDDGEHDPMEVMAFRESPDKVLQAVAELEKIAKDPYDYLDYLNENKESDEELFGHFGTAGQRMIYQYGLEMLTRLQRAWATNPAVESEYLRLSNVGSGSLQDDDGLFDLVLKVTGATPNKAFVVDSILRVYCYEGLNDFGWMLRDDGSLKQFKQALTNFVNDSEIAQDDWFQRELENFMPGQPGWISEDHSSDDELFSTLPVNKMKVRMEDLFNENDEYELVNMGFNYGEEDPKHDIDLLNSYLDQANVPFKVIRIIGQGDNNIVLQLNRSSIVENNDDDMFSRPGRLAKVIKSELTALNDPYVRTVEIVRDLAKNKFKVKTRVSAKSPRATRGQATFWFGEYATKPGEDSPKTPPVALQIKAELESKGFECKFTDSGWLSVKVPPIFSSILGEDDNDNELFGGRRLTPGYLKELVNTTGLWVEISSGEQFRVVEVGRLKQFPNEIAFRLLASYGEEFKVSYPPDMLRLDLTHQGSPVVHYGVLNEEHSDDMFSAQSKIQTDYLRQIFRAVEDLVTLTIVNVYPEDPRPDTMDELNKFMTRHSVSFKMVELALQRIASFDSFDDFYNEMLHIYSQHYKDELSEVKEPESDEELFAPEKTLLARGRDVANVLRKISFDTMSEVMKIRPEDLAPIREKVYLAILNYDRGDVLEGNAQIYTLPPRAFDYVRWSLDQAGLTSYAQRISEQRDQYQQDDMFADQSRLTQNRFIGKIVVKLAKEIYNDPLSDQGDKENAEALEAAGRVFSNQGTRQGLKLIRRWADNGDHVTYDNVSNVLWQHGIDIDELERQYPGFDSHE
jgi:hypothetical protein